MAYNGKALCKENMDIVGIIVGIKLTTRAYCHGHVLNACIDRDFGQE